MKRLLASLAAVALMAMIPMDALATCQNIASQWITIGAARRTIKTTAPVDTLWLAVYHDGNGTTTGSEPRYGAIGTTGRTLGYLPSGSTFNPVILATLVDNSVPDCVNSYMSYTLEAMSGDNCAATVGGPWISSYSVNTCGMFDNHFRGVLMPGFVGVGWAASYKNWVGIQTVGVQGGTFTHACSKVSTTAGASGCSDPI